MPRRKPMEPKSGRRAVAQTSPPPDGFAAANKSAVSRVSKPAGRSISRIAPIWKSAIQQVWKTALQYWGRLGLSRRDLSLSDYASGETGYGAQGRVQFNPAQHASREWTRVAFSKNQGNSVRQERRFLSTRSDTLGISHNNARICRDFDEARK